LADGWMFKGKEDILSSFFLQRVVAADGRESQERAVVSLVLIDKKTSGGCFISECISAAVSIYFDKRRHY
jgi:hypothetical protein